MKKMVVIVLAASALLSACGGSSQPEPQVDIQASVNCGGHLYDPIPRRSSGATMACRVRVVNAGPDSATDVRVTLSADARAGAASTSCQGLGQARCAGADGLTIRIASLPADPTNVGSVTEIGYQASTPLGLNTEFELRAQATAQGERNPSDNTASAKIQLVSTDVALSGRSLGFNTEGQPTFELRLENKGPGRAEFGLRFSALPIGFEELLLSCRFADGSECPPPTPKYRPDSIASGEAVLFRYAVRVPTGWMTPIDLNISSPPEWNGDPVPADNAVALRLSPMPP